MVVLLSTLALAAPEPIRVSPDSHETVTFTRLVVRDQDGSLLGSAPEAWRVSFIEALRTAGHDARGAESLLFAKDASSEARYWVGGTLTSIECRSWTCESTVSWELFDTRRDAVVYAVTTRGYAESSSQRTQAADQSLRNAFLSLLARPNFVAELRSDAASAAVTDGTPSWKGDVAVKRCAQPPLALPAQMQEAISAAVMLKAGARLGSGVVVSPDGWILTAAHVVAGTDSVDATLRSGLVLPAQVVRVDRFQDVALLRIQGAGHRCLAAAPGEAPLGAELFAIGSPAGTGLEFSVSKGVVSGVRTVDSWHFLQTDAAINQGNSGGPLVDLQGRLLGVVSWKIAAPGFEGLGFGVPTDAITERLDLAWGETSDTDVAARKGEIGAAVAAEKVIDPPDPSHWDATPTSSAGALDAPTSFGVEPVGKPLVWGGIGLAVLGGALAGGTYGYYATDPRVDASQWHALQAANVLGWAGVGVGGAMLIGGVASGGKKTLLGPGFVAGRF